MLDSRRHPGLILLTDSPSSQAKLPPVGRAWGIAVVLAGVFLLAGWTLHCGDGLERTASGTAADRALFETARVRTIDLAGLDAVLGHGTGVTVQWTGVWNVPATGVYDLALESGGRTLWMIDGRLARTAPSPEASGTTRTVWLDAGFHQVDITCEPDAGASPVSVKAARTGQPLAPLAPDTLMPRLPRNPRLRAIGTALHQALGWMLALALVVAVRRTVSMVVNTWRHPLAGAWWSRWVGAWRNRLGRRLAWVALAGIVSSGAVLRLDAITARYGPVTSPRWLAALQTRTILPPESLRPGTFHWQPAPLYPHEDGRPTHYLSDPYTYLLFARDMPSFYAAAFREPVFPFATRIFLRLLDGQDVAVSFTSAAFSILAIWLAYLLGAAVWSRPVGLAAALGLAIDYDAISLASAGWRDDAFVAAVALCAYLMLRCWRAGRGSVHRVRLWRVHVDAAYVDALMLGVGAGLAVLVRIMAFSFLIPGAVVLFVTMKTDWRRRVTIAGIAAVVATVVAAPYFVNCWRVYGDPLYTFNVHGNVYRVAEGQQESSAGTAAYIGGKFVSRPFEMIDTVARGLTTYPFTNKWHGLDGWSPRLGRLASIAAIFGLLLLAASGPGRLLLFVMVTSLVPFAFTWTVDPNWRFTAHTYPFLLVAAAAAGSAALWCVRAVFLPWAPDAPDGSVKWRTGLRAAAVGAALSLLGVWLIALVLPGRVFSETLRVREDAMVTAGTRDQAFFGAGWSEVTGSGDVRMRVAMAEGILSIPLPAVDDYAMTLRLDPFPRPLLATPTRLPVIEVLLNGTSIGRVPLRWNVERVGAYDLVLPRTLVRRGNNRLTLRLERAAPPGAPDAHQGQPGLTDGDAFGLWYVRVHPAAATTR